MCNKCNNNLTIDSDIFVQYVTLSDVRESTIDNNWPHYITWTNYSSGKLQCPNCENSSNIPTASLLSPAEILFVEFASDAVDNLLFYKEIDNLSLPYQLKGLIRCKNHHFTYATMDGNDWLYFDDLCGTVMLFHSLDELLIKFPTGWFFWHLYMCKTRH